MRQCEGQMKEERKTVRLGNHKCSAIVFLSSSSLTPSVLLSKTQSVERDICTSNYTGVQWSRLSFAENITY